MFYQNDDRWKNVKLNNSNETIGSVGCLLTALTNIYNDIYCQHITPEDINRELIIYNGYTSDNLIIWSAVEHILKLKIVHHYTDDIFYSTHDYFIVNYLNYGVGHFTNLISKRRDNFEVFDVWDNKVKTKNAKDIRRVVKVCKQ